MAMLSEPRRKQKLSLDPRNNNWKNDESRFGLKLMEKMGWSKGKGLGANEQGATENIKVKVKNNTVGLGATKNHEDNWIAHQDEFNQLLSKLNDCHGQNDSTATGDKALFSLEEKSKSSKKRVHYQKYTKGKDLSSRSATDLACVFGKRIKQIKVSNDDEKEIEDNANLPTLENPKALEPNVEINTVTSPLTMQEYFAVRMAQRTNRKAVKEIQQATAAQELVGNEMQSSEVRIKSKKKKRNRIIEESCDFIEPSIVRNQVKNEGDKNNVLAEDNQIKENYRCKKSRTKAK